MAEESERKYREGRTEIAMVLYDDNGKPSDACHGQYSPTEIQIFKDDGFVEVPIDLAKKIDEEMTAELEKSQTSHSTSF